MAVTSQSNGLASPCMSKADNSVEPFNISKSRRSNPAGGLRFAQITRHHHNQDDPFKPVDVLPWRMRERMKTMDVALVLCLNIGTDPPDVEKSTPCARKECWVDPFSMPAKKAIETIGNTLQSQYERWQPRARYKQTLDPTVEKVRELCVNRRRLAKNDRVLFHYNGHGVPRPTQNGEVWVFNKSYTQYIPLLVYDLQSWVGTPSIYVFDCSAAGMLLSHFTTPPTTINQTHGRDGNPSANEAIVLAACAADELLPMNPDLCADLFTSCLTTPITVALRWFISQNELSMAHLDASFIKRIPGKLTDRKTPLGELNWIFTAITDTIAWNMLPRELFQKLFRQDLLVASLFRNFLLAERIMKSEGCSPCSLPALPPTNHHSLWRSWDLAAEICLNQLYKLTNPYPNVDMSLQPSRFFAEQLTAFEVWLQFGSSEKPPPQQLPMVLQVLLSQVHRLRALVLLKKFLDLGPWAVNLALSVGIFPYVLKLLQSPASELRQVLVFIWSKILALDLSCQVDLVKDEGHSYFITHLAAGLHNIDEDQTSVYTAGSNLMPSEQKIMAAFIISVICNNYQPGQKSCLPQYVHKICINLLQDSDEKVRMWVCLCLAKLWENFDDAKRIVFEDKVPQKLGATLNDDHPEVRAAAAYALGTLVGFLYDPNTIGRQVDRSRLEEFIRQRAHADIVVALELLRGCRDGSPLIRQESVLALANVILHNYHQSRFESVAMHFKNQLANVPVTSPTRRQSSPADLKFMYTSQSSEDLADTSPKCNAELIVDEKLLNDIGEDARSYAQIWHVLKEMQSRDPFPAVVEAVKAVVSFVNASILEAEHEQLRENTFTGTLLNSPSHNTIIAENVSIKRTNRSTTVAINRDSTGSESFSFAQPQQIDSISSKGVAFPSANANHGSLMKPVNKHMQPITQAQKGLRSAVSVGNFQQYQSKLQQELSSPMGAENDQFVPNPPMSTGSNMNQPKYRGQASSQMVIGHRVSASILAGEENISGGLPVHVPSLLKRYGRHEHFPSSLKSTFYEQHKAHFNEPSLDLDEEDEDPLSETGAERWERCRRYNRIRGAALKLAPGFASPQKENNRSLSSKSGTGLQNGISHNSPPYFLSEYDGTQRKLTLGDQDAVKDFTLNLRQRAVLNNDAEMTSLLLFHPYETLLLVADEKDQISLYNFEETESKVLSMGNKNPPGSRLTSLSWINETEESLLTCGSDDGVIKIYHGLHNPHPPVGSPKLVSAFVAVPDLVPGTRGSGLVMNWQQDTGKLYAGGNSGMLRGWDLRQERCICVIPTQTDSCITSMASDKNFSDMLVAGFGDGTLRIFDSRSRPDYSIKITTKEHSSWVVQTHIYAGRNELLTGSVTGELKFWDIRFPKNSIKSLEAHRSPMTALAVHDYAPIFASGSHNQFIKVFRSDGEQLALIRYHEGFLGERIGPVSCLAFHPHRLFLAAGATDSVVAVYSSDK
ncbi:regulatory-associated protein of mtor [Plasmopara halstedii]|uniref:Regulatory-associated protein of mtor n=1 Tax=Plasmopara halstedii TaxID=4781 RepID=A0A0N7L569_PLAHL|nr:regulatory-associated protein of mtor [Plasmopara halstedii]CEG40643.1 regulatory-associated protein of mtor [Plasmopara halstedii]|eukprot:XP_024577012.1 regulatory-associated protein of mtor [Plasmopara halstedii]